MEVGSGETKSKAANYAKEHRWLNADMLERLLDCYNPKLFEPRYSASQRRSMLRFYVTFSDGVINGD